MSERVAINYGGEQIELVRSESAIVEDDGTKRRDPVNHFGILTKDDITAWEAFKSDDPDFDREAYWKIYAERNNLRPVDESGDLKDRVAGTLSSLVNMLKSSEGLNPDIEEFFGNLSQAIERERRQHAEHISELNHKIDSQKREISSLAGSVEALTSRLEESGAIKKQEDEQLENQLKEDFGDRWTPRKDNKIIAIGEDGYISDGWQATSEPRKQGDTWVIDIGDGQNSRTVELSSLGRPNEAPPPEPVLTDPPEPVRRFGIRRFTGRAGDWILGRQVAAINGTYQLLDRRGRTVIVEEEVAQNASEASERAGAIAAVGVVAVGAAAGVAGYLIGRHTGHNYAHEINETINNNFDVLRVQEKAHHAAEMKKIAANHAAEMKAIAAHDAHMTAQHVHDHKHELRAIHDLHNQIAHASALDGSATPSHSGGADNASLSYRGDTVWDEVARRMRERLGIGASTEKVRKATNYVLKLNGLNWNGGGYGVDAHKLPVGFKFRIPHNLLAVINK